MTPIYWIFLGIGLLILEVMTPGLVSLFFGLSALTVALCAWLLPLSQALQWLFFSVFSIMYILLLRKSIKKVFSGDKEVSHNVSDEFTGKLAVVVEAIAPNRPGRVEFCGCNWTAEAHDEVPVGASVRISGKKNLTLKVELV
jgi:membrane protein implicated in regulation of membrane protease activity